MILRPDPDRRPAPTPELTVANVGKVRSIGALMGSLRRQKMSAAPSFPPGMAVIMSHKTHSLSK